MANIKLLDLKSVPWPLNFVKIKLALENLSPDEELLVELDRGEPEEMVHKNLKETEYSVVKIQENQQLIKLKISNAK